jgi:hypothetical protein
MSTEPGLRPNRPRKAARQKSFLRGMINVNNGRSTFDCLIRDISPEGARLVFSSAVSIPDAFDLYIPQKEQTLSVRVTWRHGEEIGVAFAEPSAMGQPAEADDLAQRVIRLEAEITALKRALKKMKADHGPETDVA